MILRCRPLLLTFLLLSICTPTFSQTTEKQITDDDARPAKSHLNILATIRPIHSLLSFIMQGVTSPALLLDQAQSAHHYSLRPSQRRMLSHADIVFWIGESLEGFMPRILKALPDKVLVIELMSIKGLELLEPRSDDHHHHANLDPHIWLSVSNAIQIARKMADTLSKFNPANRKHYQNNFRLLKNKLTTQKNKISEQFANSKFNYLVYHDALQYFEKQINISPLAAISTDEEHAPGIKHLSMINKIISNNNVNCLIYNTPKLPNIAKNLINNKDILPVVIDPLGKNLETGPELYFDLLDSITDGYRQCHKHKKKK